VRLTVNNVIRLVLLVVIILAAFWGAYSLFAWFTG